MDNYVVTFYTRECVQLYRTEVLAISHLDAREKAISQYTFSGGIVDEDNFLVQSEKVESNIEGILQDG